MAGEYSAKKFVGTEVSGKRLVTVGYGNIGKRIIELAKGLGMEAGYINTKTSDKEFDNLISQADVVVLCLPLNEHTKGIINQQKLSLMKSSVILINVARGLIVDQKAFYQALKENKIAGAGIDTFPKDETLKTTPEEIMKFAKLPNVVATPHIGFNTQEALNRLGPEIIRDIQSCIDGNPINVVN